MMLQLILHGGDSSKLANATVQSIIDAYNQEPNTEHTRLVNEALRSSAPETLLHQHLTNQIAQFKLNQERALAPLSKQILEAKLAESQASTKGTVSIPLTDEAGKPVLGADGKQMILPDVSTDTIYKTLYGKQTGGLTEQNAVVNARNARLDTEKRIEEAAKHEQTILGTKVSHTGVSLGKNAEDPAIQPVIESFNSKSDAPYTYVWERPWEIGKVYNGYGKAQALKIPLPRDTQGQLTARVAHNDATKLNMTMKEYLEALQKRGRIKGKLPWQR